MSRIIQPSFARGELSPGLYGRVDTALYQVGLKRAYNVLIRPQGGAVNRPGTAFIGPASSFSSTGRLIPFLRGTSDKYVLLFGDQTMRVIRNGAFVLDTSSAKTITGITKADPAVVTATAHGFSDGDEVYISGVVGMTEVNGRNFTVANKTTDTFELVDKISGADADSTGYTTYSSAGSVSKIYEIATPYAVADLPNLKFVQSADVMTLTHKSYALRELSRTDHDAWTLAEPTIAPLMPWPTNIEIEFGTVGDIVGRYTVTAIGDDESLTGIRADSGSGSGGNVADAVSITGVTKADPAVVTASGHGLRNGDEVYISGIAGMTELNDRRFVVDSVTSTTFELVDEDSTNYATYTSGGQANANYVQVTLTNITAMSDGASNKLVITVNPPGEFSVGDIASFDNVGGTTKLNKRRFGVVELQDSNKIKIQGDQSSLGGNYTSGGGVWKENSAFVELTWDEVAGAEKYAVYKEKSGLFGKIGETEKTTFTDSNLAIDLTETPPKNFDPFKEVGTYPGTVGYYEQRKVFGGSTNAPDTSFFTRIGAENNHTSSIPLRSDDAFSATLAAREVNEIRHFVAGNNLLVFTSGSEWRVNSGPDTAFGFDTIKQKPQSSWGCSHLQPLVLGNTVLFTEESKAVVRSFGYSVTADGYDGTEVSLTAQHMFESFAIRDWALAHAPDSRVYMAREDGRLITCTFNIEQEINAWTECETEGEVESVCALRHDSDELEDEVFLLVKRTVGGNTVRYVEQLHTRMIKSDKDAYFVDAGLSLDSPVTITGATAADPVVITAVAHGFSNGDEVDVDDITWAPDIDATYGTRTQPDQLNGSRFTVANATTDTFELSGIDGSAFNAYVSGGEVRKAITELTGLWHLEGESVTVVADGVEVFASGTTKHVVTDGAITLTSKASRVHIGKDYYAEIQTLDLEPGSSTIQGAKTKISKVTIRVERTKGVIYGVTADRLSPVESAVFADGARDVVEGLLTGDILQYPKSDYQTGASLILRQKDPFPMAILAIVPELGIDRSDNA